VEEILLFLIFLTHILNRNQKQVFSLEEQVIRVMITWPWAQKRRMKKWTWRHL
jgi:hypothetical protein